MPDREGNFKGISVPRVPCSMEPEPPTSDWPLPFIEEGWRLWREARGYVDTCPTCGSTDIPCKCPE